MWLTSTQLNITAVWAWALVACLLTAFLSIFFSLQFGFFFLLLATLAWWVWVNPLPGLLLLILVAPFLPILKATHTLDTITLAKDVIISTLFVRNVLWPLSQQRLPYRRNILLLPVAMLFFWTAFTALRSDNLILGVLRAREIILYALLYFAVLFMPARYLKMQRLLMVFLASALLVMALGVYQWFFAVDSAVLRFDPARSIWIPRLSSALAHPSVFGQYLVIVASLTLALTLSVKKYSAAWIFGGFSLLTLPFIYLTYSRAVWIGVAISAFCITTVFVLSYWRKYVDWKTAGITAVFLLLIVVGGWRYTSLNVFVRSAFDPTYASNEERLEFLARLIGPLTNTEALIGRGLGDVITQNFRMVNVNTFDVASGDVQAIQETKDTTLVDNQYVKTFVEMGLAGILIYAWIYWYFFKASWQVLKIEPAVGLFGIGFLAAFGIQAFFIDIWDIFPTNLAFWLVAGILCAYLTPVIQRNLSKNLS